MGPRRTQHFQLGSCNIPAFGDGLRFDLLMLTAANPPDGRNTPDLSSRCSAKGGDLRFHEIGRLSGGSRIGARVNFRSRLRGCNLGRGILVCAKHHEADLPQGGASNDIDRSGELPPVGLRGLPLGHELHLLGAGPDRSLPGKALIVESDHLPRLRRIAHDNPGHNKLVVHHGDGISLPHHKIHVTHMIQQDRTALPTHVQTGQVHHDRIAPAGQLHGPARVGGHREPAQPLRVALTRSGFQFHRRCKQVQHPVFSELALDVDVTHPECPPPVAVWAGLRST